MANKYEVYDIKPTQTRRGKTAKCRIYNLNETQIEVFGLMIDESGEYFAWTGDTLNEETRNRREEITKELNKARA